MGVWEDPRLWPPVSPAPSQHQGQGQSLALRLEGGGSPKATPGVEEVRGFLESCSDTTPLEGRELGGSGVWVIMT